MSIYRNFDARAAEDEIIRCFKEWLVFSEPGMPGQGIEDACPPPDREERGAGGCDAILMWYGRRCAVEITMVEPMNQLQRYGARVEQLKLEIEALVSRAFPTSHVAIEIEAEKIPKNLKSGPFVSWIVERLGQVDAVLGRLSSVTYEGFRVRLGREDGPEVKPGFRYGLITEVDVEEELRRSILLAITNNWREKLAAEHQAGSQTVLILDAREISQLNEYIVARAFAAIWPQAGSAAAIDEVWIAMTSGNHPRFVPLKREGWIYTGDNANHREFYDHVTKALGWCSPRRQG